MVVLVGRVLVIGCSGDIFCGCVLIVVVILSFVVCRVLIRMFLMLLYRLFWIVVGNYGLMMVWVF